MSDWRVELGRSGLHQMTGLDHGHESEMLRRFVMGSEWLHAALSPHGARPSIAH
jgi:hypothetical protein